MNKKIENLIAADLIKSRIKTLENLNSFKRKISKKFGLPVISNIEILKSYHAFCQKKTPRQSKRGTGQGIKPDKRIEILLRKRAIRSLSGVVIVSVLTKPYPCPGKCLYCPTEKGMPKSYLSNEPAVMRAILNKFDPYKQVQNRLESLTLQGHPTDKIELIIIGGTWSYLPKKYREWFIAECFRACNENSKPKTQNAKPQQKTKNLKKEQKINEKAKHRIIGITIETRPDYINEKEILHLRKLGVTRVELGVQSIYDDVLKFNLRGHLIKDTIQATKSLKDAGFKICYHLMPNLPGSDLKRDEKMFKEIFTNPDFQPDLLKIYPCAVLKEAPLYKLWKKGKYKPYENEEMINLLKSIKKQIPYYCRIQRLVRDIPSPSIITGPAKISNLRQTLAEESKKENWRCCCIRCREVKKNYNPKEKLYLFRQDYDASNGREIFLSFENRKRERLYGLLRLRIPFLKSLRNKSRTQIWTKIYSNEANPRCIFPVLKNAAIIRELHTYGQLHPIFSQDTRGRVSEKTIFSPQHKGLGKKLIEEAERITKKEFGLKKISVISGIGVRDYYRKLGYKLKDSYLAKGL